MYRNIIPASLLYSLLGFASAPVHAEWQMYKFLDAGVTATDNLQLSSGDEELVYSVKPSVELSFNGNRFNSEIVAGIEAYKFNERGDNVIDPRISLSTSGALVDNFFYVNSSLDVGKLLPGDDFFNLNEDSDVQGRFKFNPFFARRIGQLAEVYVGYGHQSLDNEFDGEIDFQLDSLGFSVNRGPEYGGFVWGLGGNFERSRVNDEDFDSFNSRSIYGSVGSVLGQTVFFEVIAGQESNDIAEFANDGDATAFYATRLHYTPTERTNLVVGFSDRFYGEGPTLSFEHRVRNSEISASWTRDVSNADIQLSPITTFSEENVSVVPTTTVDLVGDNGTDRRLFIVEQFSFGYKLAGRRSDLVIDAVYADQKEIDGDLDRAELIGRIAFDRHLSPLTTVRLQYEHLVEESIDEDVQNENRIGVRLIYNFDRKERASIIQGDS